VEADGRTDFRIEGQLLAHLFEGRKPPAEVKLRSSAARRSDRCCCRSLRIPDCGQTRVVLIGIRTGSIILLLEVGKVSELPDSRTGTPEGMDPEAPLGDITLILRDVSRGQQGAAEKLFSLVYEQLRAIARKRLLLERKDHTLGATDLVHEAYLAVARHLDDRDWQSRGHFYRAAAEAMRHILVDHARRRGRVKRGGGARKEALNLVDLAVAGEGVDILAVDDAVERLKAEDPELAEIVRLRFFAGLSVDETATALGISPRTVARQWTFARAWLHRALEESD
jgi:RNA polymerase sigma factor (TIGR02999 family)